MTSRWQHDGRESIICKIGGYGLYGIELEDGLRYTVVTPWGMSEGLVSDDPEGGSDLPAAS